MAVILALAGVVILAITGVFQGSDLDQLERRIAELERKYGIEPAEVQD